MRLGCDPEIFLVDAAQALRSAVGRIGGSKEYPLAIPELGNGFAVQEDNVAIEFNIPPASTADEFVGSITRIREFLAQHIAQQNLRFSQLSAGYFHVDELQDPRAQEFGCDPDYNAWNNGRRNPRPRAGDPTLRSAGGHIHVEAQFSGKQELLRAVQLMDLFIGVPSIIKDDGHLRKSLYGKAGAFRPKSYGVEYRTPSNYWIWKDDLIRWAWDNTALAMSKVKDTSFTYEEDMQDIVTAINTNDARMATELVSKYQIPC